MRLVHSSTFELQEFQDDARPPYAILSHRWSDEEIVYDQYDPTVLLSSYSSPALDKIRGTCAKARENGIDWIWIDTCCINKKFDTTERDKSLTKMFAWYKEAKVCYAYLFDVDIHTQRRNPALGSFAHWNGRGAYSEWFQRGWTLQELLAPREMEFFDRNWVHLGSRAALTSQITAITGIQAQFLAGPDSINGASIAQKMSWQVNRVTKDEEDISYSMVGILGVIGLTFLYGEGRLAAFRRLQQKLLEDNSDESLFAWAVPKGSKYGANEIKKKGGKWGLLAPWIDCFKDSGDITKAHNTEVGRNIKGIKYHQSSYLTPMPIGDIYGENIGGGVWLDRAAWLMALHFVPGAQIRYMWKQKRHDEQTRIPMHLNCYRNGSLLKVWLCHQQDGAWMRCNCEDLQQGRPEFRTLRDLAQAQDKIGKVYGMDKELKRDGWTELTILQPALFTG